MDSIIEQLKKHEGFEGDVYADSLGFDTIGYGTLLPIDEEEAELLLRHRFTKMISELVKRKPAISSYDSDVKEVLYNMCYQLGVNGLLGFKKMFLALDNKDYVTASEEGLDSRWAKQTPNRALELMKILKDK